MKTNLFIAALSLVVLAGCSSEDEVGTLVAKSDNAITFGTYVGKQTKATEKSAFEKNDTFGVLGYYANGGTYSQFSANFMSNEKMTMQEGGTWSYTNTKYWPENATDSISFVAYYPSSISTTVTNGSISTEFTVEDTPSNQSDLMWSSIRSANKDNKLGKEINGKKNTSTSKDNVTFKFQHALSKVIFKAKLAEAIPTTGEGESATPVATVSITEISIASLANKGTFTIANDLRTGSWGANPSGEKSYTIFQASADNNPKAIDVTSPTDVTNAIGESLLTIPQSVSGKTITVKYNVTYKEPSALTVPNEVTITIPADATWASNTIYTYTLKIALTKVSMETGFETWGTGSSELPSSNSDL